MIYILTLLIFFIPLHSEALSNELDSYFKSKETECIKEYVREGKMPDWVDSCYANKIRKINSTTESEEITKGILNFHGEYLLDRLWEKKHQKLVIKKQKKIIPKKTKVKPIVIKKDRVIDNKEKVKQVELPINKTTDQETATKNETKTTDNKPLVKDVKKETSKLDLVIPQPLPINTPADQKPKDVKPLIKAAALPVGLAQGATKGFFLPIRTFIGFK